MSEAITFFENEDIAKEKCKHLVEAPSRSLLWEYEKTSRYSPRIMLNNEKIARQIHSPHSYDKESGKLTTKALDDIYNKGLSVNRISLECIEKLHEVGEKKAEKDREFNPNKEYIGLSIAEVMKIRNCYEGTEKWFTVYDTSKEDDISHADVCSIYPPKGVPNRKGITIRQKELLRKIFSTVTKPE